MSTLSIVSKPKKAFLLIGSPKGLRSASFSLGSYMMERLKEKGLETRQATVETLISSSRERENILCEVNSSDVMIVASPLYVDSLPAPVIRALEIIRDHRESQPVPTNPSLLGIVNSGFPESFQNNVAVAILRCFAQESAFRWAGGLALGAGGAIGGKPLQSAGGMARNVKKSLDTAALALAEGRPIPDEALTLMAKPLMPKWMMPLMGGVMWRNQAKKFGVQKRLYDCPYEVGDI